MSIDPLARRRTSSVSAAVGRTRRGSGSLGSVPCGPRVAADARVLPGIQKIDIAAARLAGVTPMRYPPIARAVRIAPKCAAAPKSAIRKLQEKFELVLSRL